MESQGLWLILATTFQILGWIVYGFTYYRYRMSVRRVATGLETGLGDLKGAKAESSNY